MATETAEEVKLDLVLAGQKEFRDEFRGVTELMYRHDERIESLTKGHAELSLRLSNSLEFLVQNQVIPGVGIKRKQVALSAGGGGAIVGIGEVIRLFLT